MFGGQFSSADVDFLGFPADSGMCYQTAMFPQKQAETSTCSKATETVLSQIKYGAWSKLLTDKAMHHKYLR